MGIDKMRLTDDIMEIQELHQERRDKLRNLRDGGQIDDQEYCQRLGELQSEVQFLIWANINSY